MIGALVHIKARRPTFFAAPPGLLRNAQSPIPLQWGKRYMSANPYLRGARAGIRGAVLHPAIHVLKR